MNELQKTRKRALPHSSDESCAVMHQNLGLRSGDFGCVTLLRVCKQMGFDRAFYPQLDFNLTTIAAQFPQQVFHRCGVVRSWLSRLAMTH